MVQAAGVQLINTAHSGALTLRALFERGIVAFYDLARTLAGAEWLGICWDGTSTYYHRSVLNLNVYYDSVERPLCRFAALPEMVTGKTAADIVTQMELLFVRLRKAQCELGISTERQSYLHLIEVAISDNENTNTGDRYASCALSLVTHTIAVLV